ncbi:hypothetical protein BRADI_1g58706v3 [Brachypodium distachyon]|uniref:F-box domain-containing protein n=1 Tax=Brachypodium distachyon TaxID=15368 RepID=A0A0Q3K9H4_BRADI|nr:hypothetical protein BRADI_1g58706v3 [Brachypodium distachyon]
MPPPPLELPADLVEQIFLRLPPDEPRCLFLASLVSKPWLRRLAGPSFRRRYSEHHRTLPMLGFLTCDSVGDSGNHNSRYVPTVKLCPPGPGRRYLRPLDARHGRVLFLTDPADEDCDFPELIVWDPITLEEWVIEMPDHSFGSWAAVLCAKEGYDEFRCSALHYSSQAGSWSDKTYVDHHDQDLANCSTLHGVAPNVLLGSTLYFNCFSPQMIIRYDLADRELSLIEKPESDDCMNGQVVVENGLLGLAAIVESSIHLWSREVDEYGGAVWVQPRIINLEPLLPALSLSTEPMIIGFAKRVGVVFLWTEASIFTVELKSARARNLCNKGNIGDPIIPSFFQKRGVPQPNNLIPYMSFYTPGRDIMPLPPGPSAFEEL